jgi:hypothetical protein
VQDRCCYFGAAAAIALAEGRHADAVAAGEETLESAPTLGPAFQGIKQGLVHSIEAALRMGDATKAGELLDFIEGGPPGRRAPYLEAQAQRFRTRIVGEEAGFLAAADLFRELGVPFWLAVTLLEHAELTGSEESLAEAREIFEGLEARPWLERAAKASTAVPA